LFQADEGALMWDENGSSNWSDSATIEIDPEEAERIALEMRDKMNADQRAAFKKLMRAFRHPEGHRCYFLDVSLPQQNISAFSLI
jgi:hypothetical protein